MDQPQVALQMVTDFVPWHSFVRLRLSNLEHQLGFFEVYGKLGKTAEEQLVV